MYVVRQFKYTSKCFSIYLYLLKQFIDVNIPVAHFQHCFRPSFLVELVFCKEERKYITVNRYPINIISNYLLSLFSDHRNVRKYAWHYSHCNKTSLDFEELNEMLWSSVNIDIYSAFALNNYVNNIVNIAQNIDTDLSIKHPYRDWFNIATNSTTQIAT